MKDIQLLELGYDALELIGSDLESYCAKQNVSAGQDGKRTRDAAAQTKTFMLSVGAVFPWIGYLAVDRRSRTIVGTCAFKGNPNHENMVEIAYFTFPHNEGRGYATAMAQALIQIALSHPDLPHITAHTLPQTNASTAVLQKVGMKFVGDVVDPEDGPVWLWQFDQTT